MSSGIAQRRAAKAARRKAVVAAKRKVERAATAAPLAERIRRAATAPIHCCRLQKAMFKDGMGSVVLVREMPNGELALASFLVDAYCLGVKDVLFRQIERSTFEEFMESTSAVARFVDVDPSYGRKLLQEAVAYAQAIGFAPHRDYATVVGIFGDVSAEASDATFTFGRDGKPFYVAGPTETQAQIRMRMNHLLTHLGADGFDYLLPLDGEMIDSRDLEELEEEEEEMPMLEAPRSEEPS